MRTDKSLNSTELFKRITEILEYTSNKKLKEHDITLAQIKMLMWLDSREDGDAILKDLEKYFDCSQATIAGLAVRLENKGLVYGYIDPNDRRVKHIRLTDCGKHLCQRAEASLEEGEKWLATVLEPQESKELQRLLEKIYIHLR